MGNEVQSIGSGSCSFTVRFWFEAIDGSQLELRSEVRHIRSGEVCYFRDWGSFTAYLIDKVQQSTIQPTVRQPIIG